MARRPQTSQIDLPVAEMTPAEWLKRAPKAFAAEVEEMRAKATERLKNEHEMAMKRAREAEAQLRELGLVWTEDDEEDVGNAADAPSPEWSVWRIVKHYLSTHPKSAAPDVISYVASVRPGNDDGRQMESNVLGVLYKYSRPGRPLVQTGERGSFRYTLREGAED